MLETVALWVGIVQGVVTVVALVAGTYFAWAGLSAWKRQMRAQVGQHLARRMLLAVHRLVDSVQAAHHAFRTMAKGKQAAALNIALDDTIPGVKLAHEEYRVLLVEAGGIWSKEDVGWLALAWAVANDVVTYYMMSNMGAELDKVTGAKSFARIRKESRDTLKRIMLTEGRDGLGERLKTGLEVAERILQGKLQLE